MKTTRKFLAMLLAVVMVVLCMPVSFAADIVDSGECGDNIIWTLDSEGTLTISGEGEIFFGTRYEDEYGFWYEEEANSPWNTDDRIKAVIIEEGITSIDKAAFYGCYNLESIKIPNSVTKIKAGAFALCLNLKEIVLPKKLSEITDTLFLYCVNLENVIMPENIKCIGVCAFGYCYKLKSIEIPESVECIYSEAFVLSGIETLNISKNLKSIGEKHYESDELENTAFIGCFNLKEILVDKESEYFCTDEYGVLYNKDITEFIAYPCASENFKYVLPESVKTVGGNNFMFAKNLKCVEIHKNVVEINCDGFGKNADTSKYKTYMDFEKNPGGGLCFEEPEIYMLPDFTLYGYAGTITEESAKENNIPFIALDGEHTQHDYKLINEDKAISCFDNTYKYYTCGICLENYTEVINADGHEVVIDPAVPATKKEGGLTEGSHCGVCGEILVPQYETEPILMGFADILMELIRGLISIFKSIFA